MAVNFDYGINNLRSVMRGEVNGSVRLLLFTILAVLVWLAVMWLASMNRSVESTMALQEDRYVTLSKLAAEYKTLAPSAATANNNKNVDTMTAFSQVSDQIKLGSRVSRVAPGYDGRSLSIEVNRIYAEEFVDMVRELAVRGIRIMSMELRALPAGEERLLSLTAVIAPTA